MRVTVLGGNGLLGRHLTPLLTEAGHNVKVASRSGETKANLETGEGLAEAVDRADVVVHLASDARRPQKVDVKGTGKLLAVLDRQHIVYMSIVGVDRHPFAYYRAKYDVEQMIEESGVSNSILRATQFHDFVAFFLGAACKPPVAMVPKRFVFQPIDTLEVARHLAAVVHDPRPGLQTDLGGPEVHTAEYLARTLLQAKGKRRPMVNLPVPGKAAKAFKNGVHTNPDQNVGVRTWEQYLADEFGG